MKMKKLVWRTGEECWVTLEPSGVASVSMMTFKTTAMNSSQAVKKSMADQTV